MKIKFPSSVTRKFYLYLITLKFPSYAAREFKFHLKKTSYVTQKFYSFFILTNTSLSVWLENFHFGYLKGFFVSFGDFECKESFAQSWVKKQTNRMIYLTWKFPFRIFKRCSFQIWAFFLVHFEYKESIWQIWVKIIKWSIWYENSKFGYLKGARFKYSF